MRLALSTEKKTLDFTWNLRKIKESRKITEIRAEDDLP